MFTYLGNRGPTTKESGLGELDNKAATEATESAQKNVRESYVKYTPEERCAIGKYTSEMGTAAAVRKFRKERPNLNESTVRTFSKKYKDELKLAAQEKRAPKRKMEIQKRGRPLLLGRVDEMVRGYISATRNRGGLVSRAIAIATAKALIKRNPQFNLDHVVFGNSWAKSLFFRMGYIRRAKTTSKVEIPEAVQKEAELIFQHKIAKIVETHQIPDCMILNLDQTPSKFVSSSNTTLAPRGAKSVSVAGSADKRAITATFTISHDGNFLPMQLIYQGTTVQCLPRYDFPDSFSLSMNPKHFSNTTESLKIIDEVIVPYLTEKKNALHLSQDHPSLLIMDVFRGQMTEEVLEKLKINKIFLVRVPANMTHIFQPLDLTVNGHFKQFMKEKFSAWYTEQISIALENGEKLENINISFKITVLKPLHAKWLVEFYNYITSGEKREIITRGFERAGITHALQLGSSNLPELDPFAEFSTLVSDDELTDQSLADEEYLQSFTNDRVESDDSD